MARELSRILANSTVFAGELVPDRKQRIAGVDVPIVVLGDPACPLLPLLMKPYTATGPLSRQQRRCNFQWSKARVVVKCAFGHLKERWISLMKRNDTDGRFMPLWFVHTVFYTICVACMVMTSTMTGNVKTTQQ